MNLTQLTHILTVLEEYNSFAKHLVSTRGILL